MYYFPLSATNGRVCLIYIDVTATCAIDFFDCTVEPVTSFLFFDSQFFGIDLFKGDLSESSSFSKTDL